MNIILQVAGNANRNQRILILSPDLTFLEDGEGQRRLEVMRRRRRMGAASACCNKSFAASFQFRTFLTQQELESVF